MRRRALNVEGPSTYHGGGPKSYTKTTLQQDAAKRRSRPPIELISVRR
jgi:hypothetical protein